MFSTTLTSEYEIAARLLDLDTAGVADLARAAVDASFLPDHDKVTLRAEIDGYAPNGSIVHRLSWFSTVAVE